MSDRSQRLAAVLEKDPAVASLTSFIGVDGTNATLNAGRMLINLKPLEERGERAPAVMARLLERAREIDGITLSLQPVQDLSIEDRISKAPFQFTLQDSDQARVAEWVPKLTERLRALPQLASVGNDMQDGGLQAFVEIDRDTAGRLGISVQQVGNALYNAFGQRLVSTIFTQSNQYRVVIEVDPALARGPAGIDTIHIVQPGGGTLPLSAIARVSERQTPLVISRLSQFPSATISFAVAPGHSLGEAVDAIRAAQAELGLPASMTSAFQGAARAFEASLANTLLLVLAAIITMYIVLGVLYESFIHPVTILSTLPSAAIGALAALILADSELSIVAIIGVILLIGIVKKNAILMIDFALDAERRRGMTAHDAIFQACLLRFRPIMMTTFAALFAALPLMLGSGTGSELRNPLGIVLVGGLLVSQVLTLFTTPVIYLAFDRLATRRARRGDGSVGGSTGGRRPA
jgi:multidrug efflux pump